MSNVIWNFSRKHNVPYNELVEFVHAVQATTVTESQPQPVQAQPSEMAETLLPHAYLFEKLAMVMPLFQEARDALTAIREDQRIRHGISATLADRMDAAGTFSLDDWVSAQTNPAEQAQKEE